jgi:phosphoglycerate dehydrogenase-like enzyme
MRSLQIVSLVDLTEAQLATLQGVAPGIRIRQVPSDPDQSPIPDLSDAEILLSYRLRFDPAQAPRLRWVQLAGAGVDRYLNSPAMQSSALTITSASGIHAVPIAEHVLALLLAWARRLPSAWQWQSRRQWPQSAGYAYEAAELHGTTLGIVGYGSIGRQVGRVAHCLGLRVLATRRSAGRADTGWVEPGTGDPQGEIPERFFAPQELQAMLALCDWLVLAVPLTAETRRLIGAQELSAMKPNAFLVNVARGPVVDEQALVAALRSGALAGAGLDVFEREPLPPESPLYDLANVILTPHVAGSSVCYNERLTRLFADNLRRYLAGEPLWNVIDRERGY